MKEGGQSDSQRSPNLTPCDGTRKCPLLTADCPEHGAWECCPHTHVWVDHATSFRVVRGLQR